MIAFFYASLLAIFFIFLAVNVIKGRRKNKVAMGDQGNEVMIRKIRAQANFAEYTPLFIILLYFAETAGLPAIFIHLLGVIYLFGRLIHSYGILCAEPNSNNFKFRIFGMVCTLNSIGALSLYLLVNYIISSF